jgi:N-acetylglucosamine-6-phosphate deacetylase
MPPKRFLDLQVNGYAGVDFNSDDLTSEQLHTACRRLRDDGVEGILATLITDSVERMTARLARIVRLRREDPLASSLVRGVHLEGPFINPAKGYVGAHPPEHVRPADVEPMRRMLDAGEGQVRLVTLAPEADPGSKLTRFLVRQGVRVSAGHCDPSLDQLRAAIDAGLSMFTHLGNGCPMMLDRHDNIIQRALSLADRLTICYIGDGVHVPYPALGNYLRLSGVDRSIVVTDAVAAAGMGPGRYRLGGRSVDVGEDGVARAADGSHLVGSTATMPRMAAALGQHLGLDARQVERLTLENPGKMLA